MYSSPRGEATTTEAKKARAGCDVCPSKPVGRGGAIARLQRWLMVDGMNDDDVDSDSYGSEVRTSAQREAEVR